METLLPIFDKTMYLNFLTSKNLRKERYMKIAFYPSSHGYGHATRIAALANEFIAMGIECHFISNHPKTLFPGNEQFSIKHNRQIDFGIIQNEVIKPEIGKTKEKLLQLWKNKDQIVKTEVKFLKENNIDLVIADIPPLAFQAAFEAGVPCIAVSNFSWYYIYKNLFNDDKEVSEILHDMLKMQKSVFVSYRLPFSDDFSMIGFPKLLDSGVLAKKTNSLDLREKYNIPKNHLIVLLSYGGGGKSPINLAKLFDARNVTIISSQDNFEHDNFRFIAHDEDYSSILAHCDILIGKMGYSTLAEVCQNNLHLIFSSRKDFPEEKILRAELKNYPNKTFIPFDYLEKVDWNKIFDKIRENGRVKTTRYQNKTTELAQSIIREYAQLFTKRKVSIDVGTNNVLLLWASLQNEVIAVHRRSEASALGKGMTNRNLTDEGLKRVKKILDNFIESSRLFSNDIIVTGTSCSRDAENIDVLVDWLKETHNIDYKILTEDEEAFCNGKATMETFPELSEFMTFDIGGGSTEFTLIKDNRIIDGISLKLGIRRLENMFGNDMKKKVEYTRQQLNTIPKHYSDAEMLIGIGGTATSLSSVKHKLPRYDSRVVHKSRLTEDELLRFYEMFTTKETSDIVKLIPYEPVRAGLLAVGAMIVIEIMQHFDQENFVVSDHGLQFGVFE
jgi:hypothetical protein